MFHPLIRHCHSLPNLKNKFLVHPDAEKSSAANSTFFALLKYLRRNTLRYYALRAG